MEYFARKEENVLSLRREYREKIVSCRVMYIVLPSPIDRLSDVYSVLLNQCMIHIDMRRCIETDNNFIKLIWNLIHSIEFEKNETYKMPVKINLNNSKKSKNS